MTDNTRATIPEFFGSMLVFLGGALLTLTCLGAAVLAGARVYHWLQTAEWPTWTLATLYGPSPTSDMKGLQQVNEWIWNLPVEPIALVASGVAWAFLTMWGGSVLSDEQIRRWSQQPKADDEDEDDE